MALRTYTICAPFCHHHTLAGIRECHTAAFLILGILDECACVYVCNLVVGFGVGVVIVTFTFTYFSHTFSEYNLEVFVELLV